MSSQLSTVEGLAMQLLERGLIDAGVVGDHALRERLHVSGVRLVLGQLAGVDVHLVGGDDDGGDLRVAGHACQCPGPFRRRSPAPDQCVSCRPDDIAIGR
jgi:hypothetical protein